MFHGPFRRRASRLLSVTYSAITIVDAGKRIDTISWRMRRLPALMVIILTSTDFLSAQGRPRNPEQEPQATFKSGVDLVTVSVSVRTENGRVVRDLQKSDFTVFDAGQPVKVLDFYSGDSPISLAILLDISGSMAVGGNMDRAREAVTVATMNLREDADEAALYTFDSELREVVSFTKDLERVHRVSLKGTPWGKTLSSTQSRVRPPP